MSDSAHQVNAYQNIVTAFDQDALRNLEDELGVGGQQTKEAAGAAVGTILEGLRRRSQEKGGLDDLLDALGKGEQKTSAPSGGSRLDPQKTEDIFGEIFGKDRGHVERGLGKATRLDGDALKRLLGTVLPIVLGALAKSRQGAPKGGTSLDDILGRARKDFDRQAPSKKGGGGILEAIFDRDHDGDVDLGDIAGIFLDRR